MPRVAPVCIPGFTGAAPVTLDVRHKRCAMANRTYLINHAEKAPVSLDNQRGNWLLAASYQIPVLWLAMFSDADLATARTRVRKADGREVTEDLPTLASSTHEAMGRYQSRRSLLMRKIARDYAQHIGEWERFMASDLGLPVLQLEFTELRMMWSDAVEFDAALRNWLGAFSSEDHPGWEEFSLQACLEEPEVARYGIRGYPWNGGPDWK